MNDIEYKKMVERYNNDPFFNQISVNLWSVLETGKITPDNLRQAVECAIELFHQNQPPIGEAVISKEENAK